VCTQPSNVPIEGVLPAPALTRVECSHGQTPPMTSQADHMAARSLYTREYVMLANFGNQTVTVPKTTVLGIAEVSEPLIDKI